MGLFSGKSRISKRFLSKSRVFNNAFAFTSLGTTRPPKLRGRGPPVFQSNLNLYHRIGSLVPEPGQKPSWAQLYFYHGSNDAVAAVNHRLDFIYQYLGQKTAEDGNLSNNNNNNNTHHHDALEQGVQLTTATQALDKEIIEIIQDYLEHNNAYAQQFRNAAQRLHLSGEPVLSMKILSERARDPRIYNPPTADEVAAILPGDGSDAHQDRDIVIQFQGGKLKRVSALHPSYWPLAYPLLYLQGEDGFRLGLTRLIDPQGTLPAEFAPLSEASEDSHSRVMSETESQGDESESEDQDAIDTTHSMSNNGGTIDTYINNNHEQLGLHSDNHVFSTDDEGVFLDATTIEKAFGTSAHFTTSTCNPPELPEASEEVEDEDEDEYGIEGSDDEWVDGEDEEDHQHDRKRRRITHMNFFSSRIHYRLDDNSKQILQSRYLLQQWIVDMFCTMDMNRLNYYKKNQGTLRVELYSGT